MPDDNKKKRDDTLNGNLGLLYTRRYYGGLTKDLLGKNNGKYYVFRNAQIINQARKPFQTPESLYPDFNINLTTRYPGLITGIGIFHATGQNGEAKLGLAFDHTTGLPYIPGSSVKGLLRSLFPMRGDVSHCEREAYIKGILTKIKNAVVDPNVEVCALELDIFGSDNNDKNLHLKGHDIFFDAFPVKAPKGLLNLDYITPHTKGEFQEPVPIQFMRIEPDVEFCFSFLLHDFVNPNGKILVSKEAKKSLFKALFLDAGIGAKTNVGYGQLKEIPEKK